MLNRGTDVGRRDQRIASTKIPTAGTGRSRRLWIPSRIPSWIPLRGQGVRGLFPVVLLCWLVLSLPLAHARTRGRAAPPAVAGSSGAEVTLTSLPLHEGEALHLQGMYPSRTFPIYLSPSWSLEGAGNLKLNLQMSELVSSGQVTLRINQAEVASAALHPGMNEASLSIPASVWVSGWNVAELKFYLRASDDACRDLDNPGLWAVVQRDARIELPHRFKAFEPDVRHFPQDFAVSNGPGLPPRVTIFLPSALTDEALGAAGVIAARLGQSHLFGPDGIRGVFTGNAQAVELKDRNGIYVGPVSGIASLAPLGVDVTTLQAHVDALKLGPGEAGVVEVAGPGGSSREAPRRFAAVVALDSEGLARAQGLLRWPLEAASGGAGAATSETGLSGAALPGLTLSGRPVPVLPSDSVTMPLFEEGQEPVLRGLSQPVVQTQRLIPRHWLLGSEASLWLPIQYGVLLRRSALLEISLNDRPFYSLELTPEPGAEGRVARTLKIPLPSDVAADGVVRLAFRLFLDAGDSDCTRTLDESAWVVLKSGASLNLPRESRQALLMGDFPDRFADDPSLARVGIGLADGTQDDALSAVLSAAAALGARQPDSKRLGLEVTLLSHLSSPDRFAGRHWILVGDSLPPVMVRQLKGALLLPLDDNGRLQPNLSGLTPALEEIQGRGVMQIMRSPERADRAVILAQSVGSGGLRGLAHFFGRPWFEYRATGNVLVVHPSGEATYHQVETTAPQPTAPETPESSESGPVGLLLLSLAGLMLAGGLYYSTQRRL